MVVSIAIRVVRVNSVVRVPNKTQWERGLRCLHGQRGRLILILFTACDPGVINKFVVENKTESDIRIESKLKFNKRRTSEKDSIHRVELKPQSESLLVEYGEIGNAHDKGANFIEWIETIIVKKENKL